MTTYSLYELNEYIRRVIALNLPDGLWVEAEIAQIGVSRGHRYLDLIEKDEGQEIRAQQSATLWADQYRRLRFRTQVDPAEVLQEGLSVRLKVQVTFHERYGMKLEIVEVDTAYTIGQLARNRQLTLERLHREQLVGKNRMISLPIAVQRLAVISSRRAAGLQDFTQQMATNAYGYSFQVDLFAAAVQGKFAEQEIIRQLVAISRKKKQYDAVVIIRGGGAKLDLAAFDAYVLCKKIAEMPLPVIVGIGHETDDPLVDLVAHTALKTPTAVANFFIDLQLSFETQVLEMGHQWNQLARQQLQAAEQQVVALQSAWQISSEYRLQRENQLLHYIGQTLPKAVGQQLRAANLQLEVLEKQVDLLNPLQLLKRGYSLTFSKGKIVTSVQDLGIGEAITIKLSDGQVRAKVEKKED